ncbi:MAG TPA: ABC transporter substrate-binding protein [Streptosporangiaceae bacterium]|nr:ABC transporter substrate-binding protein [Streptosporangiaceae bacterium]
MSRIVSGAALGLAAALGLTLAACGGSSKSSNPLSAPSGSTGTVVVGSANFPESQLVGEIYAQALEAKGIKVTRRFNIGAREVYYPQVVSGAITVMPEYNGALLTTSVDKTSKAVSTADVNAALTAKLPSSVEILSSSSAEDKDSVTVTAATAKTDHLTSISDLTPVAKNFVIGGPPEFKTRADGIIGLKNVYNLTFKRFQPLDEAGPITVAALKGGKVQAADLFTTDPSILLNNFFVLQDPKNLFAAQNVTPLVYKKGANATVVASLNAISAKLTTASLIQMNKLTGVNKQDYATVAKNWLSQNGLG